MQYLVLDNQHGQRNINVNSIGNSGENAYVNIGQSGMNNQYGVSNIQMGNGVNSGKGAVMNIGL